MSPNSTTTSQEAATAVAVTASPSSSAVWIARQLAQSRATAAVVLGEGGVLVGVITEQDLVRKVLITQSSTTDANQVTAESIMTKDPISVEHSTLEAENAAALGLMASRNFRHVPVVRTLMAGPPGSIATLKQFVRVVDVMSAASATLQQKGNKKAQLALFAKKVMRLAPNAQASSLKRLSGTATTTSSRPNVETVHAAHLGAGSTAREAAQIMASKHVSALLVTSKYGASGIITETDLVRRVMAEGLTPELTTLGEIMTPDPFSIGVDSDPKDTLAAMLKMGIRHLPLRSASGELVDILDVLSVVRSTYGISSIPASSRTTSGNAVPPRPMPLAVAAGLKPQTLSTKPPPVSTPTPAPTVSKPTPKVALVGSVSSDASSPLIKSPKEIILTTNVAIPSTSAELKLPTLETQSLPTFESVPVGIAQPPTTTTPLDPSPVDVPHPLISSKGRGPPPALPQRRVKDVNLTNVPQLPVSNTESPIVSGPEIVMESSSQEPGPDTPTSASSFFVEMETLEEEDILPMESNSSFSVELISFISPSKPQISNLEALRAKVGAALARSDYEEAHTLLCQALSVAMDILDDQSALRIRYRRANVKSLLGRNDEALEDLNFIIESEKTSFEVKDEARVTSVDVLLELSRVDQALLVASEIQDEVRRVKAYKAVNEERARRHSMTAISSVGMNEAVVEEENEEEQQDVENMPPTQIHSLLKSLVGAIAVQDNEHVNVFEGISR